MLLLPFLPIVPLFFNVAFAESGPLRLVMTSASAGYITVREKQNSSSYDLPAWNRTIYVGPKNAVMISFKEIKRYVTDVCIDGFINYFSWNRFDPTTDIASLFWLTKFRVQVDPKACINTACFKLFYSIFPRSKMPKKLPSRLWNCSGDDYPSFHHHLACNLKTECEDGRDETEHCPFSNADCGGLVALGDHCYRFVRSRKKVSNIELDSQRNQWAEQYCVSLGGALSLPVCAYDWYTLLQNLTKMHRNRLNDYIVGVYSNDVSLPSMYRHSVIKSGSVLHHYLDVISLTYNGHKAYFKMFDGFTFKAPWHTFHWPFYGTVCEHRGSRMKNVSFSSLTMITMNSEQGLPSALQHCMARCHDGPLTHVFLVCGTNQHQTCGQEQTSCSVSDHLSVFNRPDSTGHKLTSIPTFPCRDDYTTLSYTLVCDFISDCQDGSDESFCKHPPCIRMFTCSNSQCLSFDKVCDQIVHCQDESDEIECKSLKPVTMEYRAVPFPALVKFDGVRKFISVPMNSSQSCPDSHYRCPGEFNDCLPVYTRCNGMYDCIDHQDEKACEEMKCPGFFRCRASAICLHSDHLCDDWPHCPKRDDELSCDVVCPAGCLCQGDTFLCPQRFAAVLFPRLRLLDAADSGMTLSDVTSNTYLTHLVLARCSLALLPGLELRHLQVLDLSGNTLRHVNMTSFIQLENLKTLSLSSNPLTSFHTDLLSDAQQNALTAIDLSNTTMTAFDTGALSQFSGIQTLNLSFTSIHTIGPSGFRFVPLLTKLYMECSPVISFPADMFKDLSRLQVISTQNYKLCCSKILPYDFDESSCHGPQSEISSCDDLLRSWTYRGFMWLITCLSLSGNMVSFCSRVFAKNVSSKGFSVFVTSLTMADFIMGVYIAIIGVADEEFRGIYLHHDESWKNSVTCKLAGFLSLVSSEVSALTIWLITLDRFLVLRFPFSTARFERKSATVACLTTWLVGWLLALLPLLPITSRWEFYSQTGICIPLPVTRQEFKGWVYSFSVLIVLNFILFLLISLGQAFIYWSIKHNALKTSSTKVSRDLVIARRLISVAVTDFLCWFPIGLCGILALSGTPIPGEINVALAVFVLPLNSAMNPFVYTFNSLAERRMRSSEARLLKWLETHADVVD